MALSATLSQTLLVSLPALMARGNVEIESGVWVSGPSPAKSARAGPRHMGTLACALPRPSLRPPGSVALALSAGPPLAPIPLPGASSWGGTRLPPLGPPPARAPGLLAAGRRLPEHAPPIYRQGPPPTAISVSCQLPAAHSGRRSREPGPELSPRAGREHREPACLLSSPSCPLSAQPYSPAPGSWARPAV